jgi:serine/threonine protein kinase
VRHRGGSGPSEGAANSARTTEPGGDEYAAFRPVALPSAALTDAPPGPVLLDRYVVERELGRGGDGTVYLAFDRVGASHVAIKRFDVKPSTKEHAAEGLRRELRCGRAVNHPNVCRVFDVFEAEEHWFLTMEYAAGGTLRSLVGDVALSRPLLERVADGRAIIAGVAAIHDAGFLHRDIKPENVLRTEDGRLVVSDFGLARAKDKLTMSSNTAGTPGYQAPEVATGEDGTVASDIYSLGVLLCELLFGAAPHWEPATLGRSRLAARRNLSLVERALVRLCNDCLSQAAGLRPKSAAELDRRLVSALAVRRTLRRRVALSVALVGAALVGLFLLRGIPRQATLPRIVNLTGEAADWSSSKVLLKDWTDCLEAVPPERRILRASVIGQRSIDIDVETGVVSPSPTAPETYRDGCPRVSPDGKSMLFSRAIAGTKIPNRFQIMLSRRADGREAVPIAAGALGRWLPSGDEFLMRIEGSRLAVGNLRGERSPLSRLPQETMTATAASNDLGDRLAVALNGNAELSRIDIYSYPQFVRLDSVLVDGVLGIAEVSFDHVRNSFLFGVRDRPGLLPVELTAEGRLVRIGRMPGGDILRTTRTKRGLAFFSTATRRNKVILAGPDHVERVVATDAVWARASTKGDVIFTAVGNDDSRRIALKRAGDATIRMVTEGPADEGAHISRDGKQVVYIRTRTGEFVHCGTDGTALTGCNVVQVDPEASLIHHLQLSPDGDEVAYVSGRNEHKVRVIRLGDHRMREVLSTSIECPIRWSSPSGLWIRTTADAPWTEIDSVSGAPTQKTWTPPPGTPSGKSLQCFLPPDGNPYQVRIERNLEGEVRLLENR